MLRLEGIQLAAISRHARRSVLVIIAAVMLFVLPAHARNREPPLSDYSLTSWTTKDGLSSSVIWALAQDTDGYLWIGTTGGLIRFDGAQFVNFSRLGGSPLPRSAVRSLYRAHDGSLWIGFSSGEICHFQNGQLRTYIASDNSPGIISSFSEDRSGTMWAGSATGLLVFDGDRWQKTAEGRHWRRNRD